MDRCARDGKMISGVDFGDGCGVPETTKVPDRRFVQRRKI